MSDIERNLSRYSERALRVHDRALRAALRLGHNYIDIEHLLLAISQEPDCPEALRSVGASMEEP